MSQVKSVQDPGVGHYDIHGLIRIDLTGTRSTTGTVMDKTLESFKCLQNSSADLNIVLGEYPSNEWLPAGYTVGDRLLYDFDSDFSTVFKRPTTSKLVRNEVEYVIRGDITSDSGSVTVYVPRLAQRMSYIRAVARGVGRRSLARTILATAGNPSFRMEEVELDAARLRLAVLEPFLYYRLPFKGASLVHASVVSQNGSGLMIAGSGHIGKTALSLEMVKRGYSYLGDDLVIADGDGQVLSYPEPMRIQEQHLSLFPGVEQRIMVNMGSFQRFLFQRLLRTSPGQVLNLMPRLPISEIVSGASVADKCSLDTLLLVRKGGVHEPVLEEVDEETAAGILAAELFWEFEVGLWRHTQYMYCPACAKGRDFIVEEGSHHDLIKKVLRSSIKKSRLFRLKVPYEYQIRNATKFIDQILGNKVSETPRMAQS